MSPAGRRLAEAFELFARGSRQYLAVATIFGAALCDVVALSILDIRYAWLWGLLAFVTNYIPNVGFLIRLVPPTIVALLDHDVETAVAVVVIYTLLDVVLQRHPTPGGRQHGRTVGDSELLSLLIWTSILGGVGALLAVPASLFVKAVFIDVDPRATMADPLALQLDARRPGGRHREAAARPDAPPDGLA